MLIILVIPRKAFISASLVTKSDVYKFIWVTLWEINLFESVAFSKTSGSLGSLEKSSNMFVVSSHCTFSLALSVLFHLQMADFL